MNETETVRNHVGDGGTIHLSLRLQGGTGRRKNSKEKWKSASEPGGISRETEHVTSKKQKTQRENLR